MRIVFIGAGDIGLPSLEALIAAHDHELIAVVTQPDKPVGRSQKLTPSAIKLRALAAGVPVLQPEKIRDAVAELQALHADVFVVVAYGQILSRAVLDIPAKACLNIHASLLPRHRGASPIQAAIREGDAETGIAIMWMDAGLDTGDVLLMEPVTIEPNDTGGILHDRLAAVAPGCLMRALTAIAEGNAPRVPQDSSRATLTKKLERHHGRIVWDQSAEAIERLVRAYQPWPGTYGLLPIGEGKTTPLKVHRAQVIAGAEVCPIGGTVTAADNRLLVACGRGVIELIEVQAEGGKRMSAGDYLRGHPLAVGLRFQ
ncbi:MAG: methionyl-tRNA formyltransferase [Verrucomicrobia bacterium]|nr:methionyl-tRNA formyltransferase [Verrucomicrobiota bacterium]